MRYYYETQIRARNVVYIGHGATAFEAFKNTAKLVPNYISGHEVCAVTLEHLLQ